MEGYVHLGKIMNNVDEVLKKTNPDYSTMGAPTREVQKLEDNDC